MKNKSVPGYKRVFAWMIAVFAMVIPWISYLRIWKLTDAQADVFENYNGYVFDFFLYYREVLLVVMAVVLLAVMIGEKLNDYGWWYIRNGALDLTYNGPADNQYGTADNEYGTWNVVNGHVEV